MVCQWFALNIIRTVSPGLASKLVTTVSFGLALKSVVEGFSVSASKLAATIW
jgi:hypothetical protein